LLRPTLNLVPKRDKRGRDDDNSFDGERSRSPEAENSPHAEDCESIMDVIKNKGEVHEQLLEHLKKIQAPREIQLQLLIEIILMKYAVSFDHSLYYIRRVRPVFDSFLLGNQESQQEAFISILKAYNFDQMTTQ